MSDDSYSSSLLMNVREAAWADAVGPDESFDAFVDRHLALCFRVASAMSPAAGAATSCLATAIERVARNWDAATRRERSRVWILRYVVAECIAQDQVLAHSDVAGQPAATGVCADLRPGDPSTDDILRYGMGLLPSTVRAAVVLRDVCRLSRAEAEEVLESGPREFSAWLQDGRMFLRDLLDMAGKFSDVPVPAPNKPKG